MAPSSGKWEIGSFSNFIRILVNFIRSRGGGLAAAARKFLTKPLRKLIGPGRPAGRRPAGFSTES